MQNRYVLSATTENSLRVLQRIATIFTRNRLNVEQMNVFETAKKGISHFTIVVNSNEAMMGKIVKQCQRIVEVIDIGISTTLEKGE